MLFMSIPDYEKERGEAVFTFSFFTATVGL